MNKAEKIKAEIKREIDLCNKYSTLNLTESTKIGNNAQLIVLKELLSFIDSLSDTEEDFGIKESVIPSGASDSELMEATYFIPQGYYAVIDGDKVIIKKGEDPVSNDLEEAAKNHKSAIHIVSPQWTSEVEKAFKAGAEWQKENLWKDAQGDNLPEIDREVIVLVKSLPEYEDSLLKVSIAHRPPEYWMGKNIGTGEITRYEPKRYDKGGWNQPNVVYWLDVELPKEEE